MKTPEVESKQGYSTWSRHAVQPGHGHLIRFCLKKRRISMITVNFLVYTRRSMPIVQVTIMPVKLDEHSIPNTV